MRDAFTRALMREAESDPRLTLVTGDLGFGVLKPFWEAVPDQFINVGIAEQNMTSIAAGMALEGREPFDPGFPLTIEVTFTRSDYCDMHDTDWRERVDARTMRRVSHKIESYYDILI